MVNKIRIFFLIVLSVTSLYAAGLVNVPLDYWGYEFLDRMEARGVFSMDLNTRPVSRYIFADFLYQVEKKQERGEIRLSRVETETLEQLKGDFIDEIKAIDPKVFIKSREKHTLYYSDSTGFFYGDVYAREAVISKKGEQYDPDLLISETTAGAIIRGSVLNKIDFYLDAQNMMTRGDDVDRENFNISQGRPIGKVGENVYQDQAIAYLYYGIHKINIEIGKDEIAWGPGYRGNPAISSNMLPENMIRFNLRFKRFKFTSLHSFLSSSLGSKYLAAHRLDILIKPGIVFGAGETVIYGNRNVELAYLNPIMPYHVAEHHLGDKDNNNLFFDLNVTLIPCVKAYAELFVDDMNSSKNPFKYFGTKLGFLAGAHWVNPLGLDNSDFRLEYTRIDPYVYTHWDSMNIYTNYDNVIGNWMGPDADDLFVQFGINFHRDVRLECFYEKIRSGEGEANTKTRPFEGDRKIFLEGVVESRQLLGFKLRNQIRRDIFLSLSYTFSNTKNTGHILDNDFNDHLARFEFFINY